MRARRRGERGRRRGASTELVDELLEPEGDVLVQRLLELVVALEPAHDLDEHLLPARHALERPEPDRSERAGGGEKLLELHAENLGDPHQGLDLRLGCAGLDVAVGDSAQPGALRHVGFLVLPREVRPRPGVGVARQRVGEGAKRGDLTGPSPTDRGQLDTKRHVLTRKAEHYGALVYLACAIMIVQATARQIHRS